LARVQLPGNLLAQSVHPRPGDLVDPAIWLAALGLAAVASAETLLCAGALDRLHRGPRTDYNRELAAQGVGNAICGLLGALPMTAVIARCRRPKGEKGLREHADARRCPRLLLAGIPEVVPAGVEDGRCR
jgi:sulfate permease family protein